MAIQPLQLPPIINLPQPNFSVLGDIGNDLNQMKLRQQAPGLVADAFSHQQPNQPLPQPTAQETGTPLNALGTGATKPGIGSDAVADYSARARTAESGGNASARNPNSSAGGLYQFTDSTWLQNFDKTFPQYAGLDPQQKLALKTDPSQQGKAAQDAVFKTFTTDNAHSLNAAGIPVNNATLYAAHFFGAGDAPKVLTADPNAPVSSVVQPSTIAANPFLANMTVGQAQNWLASKMGMAAPQGQPATAPTAQPAMPGLTPEMGQRIGAMLTNPYTAQLGQALLSKYAAGTQIVQGQNGSIFGFNPAAGTFTKLGSDAKPIEQKPGTNILNGNNYQPVGPQNGNGIMDANTLHSLALRFWSGDKSVGQNLGRGDLGTLNSVALQNEIQRVGRELGKTPDDVARAQGDFQTAIKAREGFGTGTQGNTVRSLNVAIDHLGTLRDLAQAMQNRDVRTLNTIKNVFQREFGYAMPTNLEAAKHIVAGEITKVIAGTGGALGDREELAKPIDGANSWDQIAGVIDNVYTPLMAGQMNGLKKQFMSSAKGTEEEFNGKLTDRTRQAMKGAREPSQPNPAAPQKVQTYSDVNTSMANAKAAVGKGAPRDQIIKRLIDSGVPPAMANRL